MSTSGSTFTDWQQIEDEDRPLLVDDDFSWSEVPIRRRRPERAVPVVRKSRGSSGVAEATRAASRVQASRTDADLDEARRRWSASYEQEHPTAAAGHGPSAPARPAVLARSTVPARSAVPARPARPAMPARPAAPARLDGFDAGADTFDRDDAASYATAKVMEDRSGALDLRHSGRRTVIITGRGDSRYTLAPTRRRSSELRFHERSSFNPDRTAMWAVLLGIALLIGCVAH